MTTKDKALETCILEILKGCCSWNCEEGHMLQDYPIIELDLAVKALMPMLELQRRCGRLEAADPELVLHAVRSQLDDACEAVKQWRHLEALKAVKP